MLGRRLSERLATGLASRLLTTEASQHRDGIRGHDAARLEAFKDPQMGPAGRVLYAVQQNRDERRKSVGTAPATTPDCLCRLPSSSDGLTIE
ncbi:hypothetical protein P7K49_034177 [Saguinus oedipus]|uniref:Uncharacterized protein n=1 Tax=Saguinus oedipus TaxID=9490 RepID=A0ABQ9TUT0_SAGOE|nr:hypothetical protein P7K49_034177 [Saguinus oedipus]